MRSVVFLGVISLAAPLAAQPLRSLKNVPVPEPAGLSDYVRDRQALIVLGKALFWDMQAGSDGRTACATCHFHAGADHRSRNQLMDPVGEFTPNALLLDSMFPFRALADPSTRNSSILRDSAARAGSSGLFRRRFLDIVPGEAAERGEEILDAPAFTIGGMQVRRVTARNTPSSINAVFNVRNFWDGRASRVFNGFNPSGDGASAPGALVFKDGELVREPVRLDNASLASQAVGPVLDHLEMSYAGRTWPKLGKKMFSLPPLALQQVSADDSVLGPIARAGGRGLDERQSYLGMVRAAFLPKFWESGFLVNENGEILAGRTGEPHDTSEFTQAEFNFPVFWGLSLLAYQATLVSNDAPFDRFQEGDPGALTQEQQDGLRFYQTAGRCSTCHGGAEFTAASFSNNGRRAFQSTGVRPAGEDPGQGNASFKTSGLRNIELTGPYFHNGGQATLEQVVDFYARGGDFANGGLRAFNMTSTQKSALVAFLKSLTDDRVRFERAPFDHPELCVPAGHVESRPGVLVPAGSELFPRASAERWVALEAVGASGNQVPLRTFPELLAGAGGDGSRAHAMTAECTAPLP